MSSFSPSARLMSIGRFGRIFLLSGLVGVAAGLGAITFYFLLQTTSALVQGPLLGMPAPEVAGEPPVVHVPVGPPRPWLFFLFPALGGLASGLVVWRWAPEAEGEGTDATIEAYHHKGGHVRSQVPLVKVISSAITIGTGGSGGREGPISQIGAGFGSWLGRALNLGASERRCLMAAGMGAGVGAIFRAPLAGAIFAGEILYGSEQIEPEVLVPSVLASIVAFSTFGAVFGMDPLFRVPDVGFTRPLELVPYAVLGALATLVGIIDVRIFFGLHRAFLKLPLPRWMHPCIGGLVTGAIAYCVPGTAFTGYGDVQEALLGHRSLQALLALAFFRILTTGFSIGSGGSGGVFGPSMVIGGCLGGAVGVFFHGIWPDLVQNPASFVIVGMAGFYAGIARAPIATIIMVSEITGNYHLLVPAMWVCTITFLTAGSASLYEKQLRSRSDSPAHRAEFAGDVLAAVPVEDAMTREVQAVAPDALMGDVRRKLEASPLQHFPVLDAWGRFHGVLSFARLRSTTPGGLESLDGRRVSELMQAVSASVTPGTSLREAAQRFAHDDVDLLVVADTAAAGSVVGVLTPSDLVRARQDVIESRMKNMVERPV